MNTVGVLIEGEWSLSVGSGPSLGSGVVCLRSALVKVTETVKVGRQLKQGEPGP